MNNRTELVICLGSTCYNRGGKELMDVARDYIEKNSLSDKIILKSIHCFDNCEKAPNLKINDRLYEKMTGRKLIEVLDALV